MTKMDRHFITKVWGFDADRWSVQGFNQPGHRDTYLRNASPDDWLVLVCSFNEAAAEEDRGRILGRVRLARVPVELDGKVARSMSEGLDLEKLFHPDGRFRWPYGLVVSEAEVYVDRPLVVDVLGRNVTEYATMSGAVDADVIEDGFTAKLAALETRPVEIGPLPAGLPQEVHDAVRRDEGLRFNNNAPRPSHGRREFDLVDGESDLYLLRLVGADRRLDRREWFKVGRTNDLDRRLRELNNGLFSTATGCRWEVELTHRFATADAAHAAEDIFKAHADRVTADREREAFLLAEAEAMSCFNSAVASALVAA